MQYHGIVHWNESPSTWPWTLRSIEKWKAHLKENVYHANKTSAWSSEAVAAKFELSCHNAAEIMEKACVCVTISSAMRIAEVYEILSMNVKFVSAQGKCNRHYKITLDRNKSDPDGTGPEEGRVYYIPCHCMEVSNVQEKKWFSRQLKSNDLAPCCHACPFGAVKTYLDCLEDPFGEIRQIKQLQNPSLPPLRFMRALTAKGDRQFTLNPLGINLVNARLPVHLRPVGVITGHSGRTTHCTEAVASGCDATVIAKTKHKSPAVLMGYVKRNPEVGMRSAISIGKRVAETAKSSEYEENSGTESSKENMPMAMVQKNSFTSSMKQFMNNKTFLNLPEKGKQVQKIMMTKK